MAEPNGITPVYAVRVSDNFASQTDEITDWQTAHINLNSAEQWYMGLQNAKASLATFPQRCGVATENRAYQKKHPGSPLHIFLYQYGRSTWRLLFTIHEAEGGDPPYVKLHQLRNAAQKPMTKWPDEE